MFSSRLTLGRYLLLGAALLSIGAPKVRAQVKIAEKRAEEQVVEQDGKQDAASMFGYFQKAGDTGFEPAVRGGVQAGVDKKPKRDKDDILGFLNHINLNKSGSIWIGFHGQTRARNWFHSRPMLNAFGGGGNDPLGAWDPNAARKDAPPGTKGEYTGSHGPYQKGHNDAGRFYVRNLLSADLHLGSHLRVYGQLVNADAGGWRPYMYGPFWNKDLDVQQAFFELAGKAPKWTHIGGHGGFIFGRQEFADGPEYLISTREVPTMPQSWNGFRVYHFWKRVRIDAYDFVATNDEHPKGHFFKDTEMYNRRLYGFNTSIALPSKHGLGMLDLFYLGFNQNGGGLMGNSTAATYMDPKLGSLRVPGSTARNNFGFRLHGTYDRLIYSIGGIYQTGTFHEGVNSDLSGKMGYAPDGWKRKGYNNGFVPSVSGRRRNIQAFAVNTSLAYKISPKFNQIFGVQTDIYSGGGGNSRTGTLNTYIAPNISLGPNPLYLDPTASLNGANLIGVQPFFKISPIPKRLTFKIAGSVFWRYSKHDGTYAYLMSGLHTLRPWKGHYMGFVPRLEANAVICKNVSWSGFIARWMTGSQFSRAGASSTTAAQSNFFFHF